MEGTSAAGSGGVAELLRPLIPRALLDGPGWDRFLAATTALPDAGLGTFFGCEFRLGEEPPAADLGVVVRPGSALARHYVRRGEAAPPGSPAAALGRLFARLGQADPALRAAVAGTMLEYDLAAPPGAPEPGVFLKLPPAASEPHGRPQRVPIAALAGAVGRTEAGAEQRAAARALAALPPQARVVQIGAMPSRQPRAVRLVIQELGRGELAGVLERWGRRETIGPAAEVLSHFEEVLPRFRLAVDVTAAGLLPRIGVELYPAGSWRDSPDSWLTTGRSDWRPVAERLAQRGWCLPAKAQGLLDWCAFDRRYDRRGVFLIYKGINHVKLTLTAAGIDAKAYAGITFQRAGAGQAHHENSR